LPCGGCCVACGGSGGCDGVSLDPRLGLKFWQIGFKQRISLPTLRAPGVPHAGHLSPPIMFFNALKNPMLSPLQLQPLAFVCHLVLGFALAFIVSVFR
jgi:hypothetical protein